MESQDMADILDYLQGARLRFTPPMITSQQVLPYMQVLRRYDREVVAVAAHEHISLKSDFPTPSDLRVICARLTTQSKIIIPEIEEQVSSREKSLEAIENIKNKMKEKTK